MNIYNKAYRYTMGILLLTFIGAMFFLNIITPNRIFSDSENRRLEQAPKFSLEKIMHEKFTSNYEKYISDQFALRDFWIGVKSDSERVIGKKESNGVYLGKDGFLIQKFNKPDMENLKNNIKAINEFSTITPDIKKYFMLIPNTVEILKDKLPLHAYTENQLIYMEQIEKSLKSNVKFVDIYEELNSKKNEYIFYKTDHHWTSKGAYYAYEKLSKEMGLTTHDEKYFDIKKVTDSFYGSLYSKGGFRHLAPDSIDLYIPKVKEEYTVDYGDNTKPSNSIYDMKNLNKKDKYTVFFNGNHPFMKIKTNTNNGKKLLIVKDSYANTLIPFLTGHYNEIYVVDLRYYNEDIKDLMKTNEIKDMLILYNVNSFCEDTSVSNISFEK